MRQHTNDQDRRGRLNQDQRHDSPDHCPNCGKPYQPRRVNAADYRVDYQDAYGTGHLCAACWYGRPSDVPARRRDALAVTK